MWGRFFDYPGPFWRIWALFTWLAAAVATVLFSIPFLLSILFCFRPSVQTIFIRGWCSFMLWICRLKVNVYGQEKLDPKTPYLLVTNHQSLMDIPVAFAAISGDIRMVAKKELFYIPIMGQCMKAGGFIPISRGDRGSSSKALKQVKDSFAKGIRVWVAPEGTRSLDGKVSKFKWGSFALAIEAGVPIQPIAVINTYKVLSRNCWLPKIGQTIDVYILEPEFTVDLTSDDKAELTQKVENKIRHVVEASI